MTSCILGARGYSQMIHNFQQSTTAAARRWEGQCIYRTSNALAYKKYCRVRPIQLNVRWGDTGKSAAAAHPHRVELADRQPPVNQSLCSGMTCIPYPAESCFVVWDTTALPTCTPIHSSAGATRWPRLIAASAAFTWGIWKLPTVLGRLAVSLQK